MYAFFVATVAKPTVWEKLNSVPKETWLSLLVFALAIFVLTRVWKNLSELNEIVPWIVFLSLGGAITLYWTYERKEPKILSPIFDQLSQILPSKIEYKEAPVTK